MGIFVYSYCTSDREFWFALRMRLINTLDDCNLQLQLCKVWFLQLNSTGNEVYSIAPGETNILSIYA